MKFMRSRPRSIPPKQTPKHTSEAYPLDKPSSGDTVFSDEPICVRDCSDKNCTRQWLAFGNQVTNQSSHVYFFWACQPAFRAWHLEVASTRHLREWTCQPAFKARRLEVASTRHWREWTCQPAFKAWHLEVASTRHWRECMFWQIRCFVFLAVFSFMNMSSDVIAVCMLLKRKTSARLLHADAVPFWTFLVLTRVGPTANTHN